MVRDRVLHHALYRQLYWPFHQKFIADSFSCRLGKGTHKALNRFRALAYKVSRNHTQTTWVLKCDIKKFFASVDQKILLDILRRWLPDENVILLLKRVIFSFHSDRPGVGLPLGNLTSQLLVNIYMNEFDQFVKQKLRIRHYLRYTDDFVILSPTRHQLENLRQVISDFLESQLKLDLHPRKVFIKTLASGLDFLGWVHFPDHRVLRGATRRRMFKKLKLSDKSETVNSYLGLLSHGNTQKLKNRILC
jgi:retron-type reverse transcriptase